MLNEYSKQKNAISKGDKQLGFHIMDVMNMRHCIRCNLSNHFIATVMQKSRERKERKSLQKSKLHCFCRLLRRKVQQKKKKAPNKKNPPPNHTNIIISIPFFIYILQTEREKKNRKLHLCHFTSTALNAPVSQNISTLESLNTTSCVFNLSTHSCL